VRSKVSDAKNRTFFSPTRGEKEGRARLAKGLAG
jgi:hypothetical protein